jgi:AcrR family transcriptional regulator
MAETRAALILAGLAEFVEHGFDVPSLDRICSRAGFTRGAFYVHFENREDFIVAVMEARLVAFLETVFGDPGEQELATTLRRFTTAVREMADGAPKAEVRGLMTAGGVTIQLHRMLDAAERSPQIRERLVGLLGGAISRVSEMTGSGQGAGTVRTDVSPELLAEILVVLSIGAVTAAEAGLAIRPERSGEALLQLLKPA